jgi:hypothetical protein
MGGGVSWCFGTVAAGRDEELGKEHGKEQAMCPKGDTCTEAETASVSAVKAPKETNGNRKYMIRFSMLVFLVIRVAVGVGVSL